MTMIAFTTNKRVPVILGDLLLSSSRSKEKFIIPTLGEDVLQYLSENSVLYPIELKQKIYILKDNVCIAFSGIVSSFKKFFEDIRIFCKTVDEIDAGLIENFLKNRMTDEGWKNFSFIILVANKVDNEIILGHAKHGHWFRGMVPTFSEVWVSGSGSMDFIEEISDPANILTSFGDDNPEHDLMMNVLMITKILSRERALLHSVKRHWGAGFEMIFFNGKKFEKVDNIVYILNQGILTETGPVEVPVPGIILHYKYHGEILAITCIRTLSGTTTPTETEYIITSRDLVVRRFFVTPIDHIEANVSNELPKDFSFVSHNNSMGYIFETESNYYMPASFQNGTQMKVEFQQSGFLQMTMEKQVNDQLIQEGRKALFKKA